MRRNKEDPRLTKAAKSELAVLRWQVDGPGRDVTRIQEAIVAATARATLSLTDLARDARMSDTTLSSWRRGVRVPTPEALDVLAQVLMAHAQVLIQHAARLSEAAEEMATHEGRAAWLSQYE